ncbi:MAG TPA: helix-turn-helix domain-containing protein, partial [Patescibacteria group bacterium]|nr:helix-turn-helix domain-containing protein [Patescibacteria group bacterium]
EIAGLAKNGKEALEAYKELKPHLIITDIQMPVMDGLELIKNIRAEDRGQRFVILSCHENFRYAKEAIKQGVSDYLLKDLLTPQDLYSLLEKVKYEIQNEARSESFSYEHKPFPVPNESFHKEERKNTVLQDIVFENLTDKILKSYISEFNLELSAKHQVLFCIVIDDYLKFKESFDRTHQKRIKYEIVGLVKNTLDKFNGGECFYDEKGVFVAIAGVDNSNSELYFLSACHAIASRIRINLLKANNISVTISVSNYFSSLKDVMSRYNEALEIVKYRMFLGKGKTIMYNIKFVKTAYNSPDKLDKRFAEIKESLEKGEIKKAKDSLKNIYSEELSGFMQFNYLRYLNSHVISIIGDFCRVKNISYVKIFNCDYLPMEKLEEYETIEDILNWLCETIEKIIQVYTLDSGLAYSKHVSDAIKYIKQNYGKKMGLSQISKELNINKAYLCRIFKGETGENLTDYLNKVRIDQAKHLLTTTNHKMYEIAEMVGFSNNQHFNSSFKKMTGQNPLMFKNKSAPNEITK